MENKLGDWQNSWENSLKYSFHKTLIYYGVTCIAKKQIDFSL